MTTSIVKLLSFTILLTIMTPTFSMQPCDPNDPTTCGYGGKCEPIFKSEHFMLYLMYGYKYEDFACICNIECYNKPRRLLCNPKTGVTYYNEYCIKKEECHAQRPIVANCEGKCGSCKMMKHDHWRRCTIGIRYNCRNDELCYEDERDTWNYICKK